MSKHIPKVLVVEDDLAMQRLLKRVLSLHQYQSLIARDFDEALQAITSEHCFDLILLDVQFPGGGGLKLLPHLKKECEKATVIVVSATEDQQLVDRLLSEGAADFIGKPFDVDVLLDHIQQHLQEG